MLEDQLKKHIDLLIKRYPMLENCRQDIINGYLMLEDCYAHGGKLLIAGNGGSAADAEHIAGELMKRFKTPRPVPNELKEKLIKIDPVRGENLSKNLERPLMAIPLVAHEALTTAYINDVDGLGVFAQQLYGFGKKGDVFLGISTSGNSQNIMSATVVARALGIKVLGLTGALGGELSSVSDICVKVPETETYMIQELHLPIYHCWCLMLEDHFFGEKQRVKDGVKAWKKGNIEEFGQLMFQSGRSSIELYETGSENLKDLQDIFEHTDGIYGGRFSGAGFNGSSIALINPDKRDEIADRVKKEYVKKHPELENDFRIYFVNTADGIKLGD